MNKPFIQIGNVILYVNNILAIYHCKDRVEVLCVGLREAMVFRGERGEALWIWAQSVNTQCLLPLRAAPSAEKNDM